MILVTGVTSFVGRAVVRRLVAQGFEVCCLVESSRFEQELPTDVTFSIVSASLGDGETLRRALEGIDAVVHLSREEERPQERELADHAEGTRQLVAAAAEANISRFIYLSRLGATPASAYPLFRIKGESEIMVAESGLHHTVLRSAIIYGPDDAFTIRLVMVAKMCPLVLPIPDVGMVRFQPVWVEDVAHCVVDTLNRDDLIGRMIPLGGPEHFTLEQLVRRVLESAGMRRRLVRVGIPVMRAGQGVVDRLLVRHAVPEWWLDLAAVGSATDLGTIPKHFSFEPSRFAHRLTYLRLSRPWRRLFIRHVLGR